MPMYTLGIHSSTAKRFDPNLHLCGQSIPFIAEKSIKFLGGLISVPTNVQKYKRPEPLTVETRDTTWESRHDCYLEKTKTPSVLSCRCLPKAPLGPGYLRPSNNLGRIITWSYGNPSLEEIVRPSKICKHCTTLSPEVRRWLGSSIHRSTLQESENITSNFPTHIWRQGYPCKR